MTDSELVSALRPVALALELKASIHRHRETESQRTRMLCVSVTLWPVRT